MVRRQHFIFLALATALVTTIAISAQTQGRGQQPPRDTSGQPTTTTAPAKGRISGHVFLADTARPVARARVLINAAEVPGGRGALTDADGAYEFAELPAGRY